MTDTQRIIKDAVLAGYWHTFRFNPDLVEEGKNPFSLDSKEPNPDAITYRDFIMREVRYSSLARKFPEKAEELFTLSEKQAKEKYDRWSKFSKLFE